MRERKSYDGRLTRWLDGLLSGFGREALAENPNLPYRELDDFTRIVGVAVLQEVLADGWAAGAHGGVHAMVSLIADNLGAPVRTTGRILRQFGRAGILLVVHAYDDTGRQRPLEIVVNPDLLAASKALSPKKIRDGLASVFARRWLAGRDQERDYQGFGDELLLWGTPPPALARMAVVAERLGEVDPNAIRPTGNFKAELDRAKAGDQLRAKVRKAADRETRKALADRFIAGAATVWVTWRSRKGFGVDAPAWAGATAVLPPAARSERNEIVRLFELYGGMKTALAWTMFCGASPKRDEKDRRVYDPNLAYKQNAGEDKKPKVFSANFIQLLDQVRAQGWPDDPVYSARVREIFGETYEAAARNASAVNPYTPQATGATHGDTTSARA